MAALGKVLHCVWTYKQHSRENTCAEMTCQRETEQRQQAENVTIPLPGNGAIRSEPPHVNVRTGGSPLEARAVRGCPRSSRNSGIKTEENPRTCPSSWTAVASSMSNSSGCGSTCRGHQFARANVGRSCWSIWHAAANASVCPVGEQRSEPSAENADAKRTMSAPDTPTPPLRVLQLSSEVHTS